MRKLVMGVAAVAMTAGVALAQAQQEQPATGQAAGEQGARQDMMGQSMMGGQGQSMMGGQGMGMMGGQGASGGQGMCAMMGGQGCGMMGQGRGSGMMTGGQGMRPGMGGDRREGMKRHMMLMMFALVDQDGNERLSLEEVQALHARLFGYADADDDGELTMQELARFMHGGPALGGAEGEAQ